jgi:hypothetical protein
MEYKLVVRSFFILLFTRYQHCALPREQRRTPAIAGARRNAGEEPEKEIF